MKEEKSQIKFDVDPINDYTLKSQYQTKFRISNEEKIKKKHEIRNKLTDINQKLKQIGNENVDVFEENKIDSIKPTTSNKKSSKRFEEESDNESLCDDDSLDIDEVEENKSNIIVTPKKKINAKNSFDINKDKNLNIKNVKDSIIKDNLKSNVSPNIIKTKEHLFKDDPQLDDSSISFSGKEEEDSSDNQIAKNLLNEDENEIITNENTKESVDLEEENEDQDEDQNEDDEYEELEDDEEFQEIEDDAEYDELDDEEGYEIEDDDLFDFSAIKKFNPQQLMYFQNMFNPPDFKKDLLNKSPGEKNNEVNYQSLKDAIKNSIVNMKNLKKMKNEVYHHKTNEILLGKKKNDKSKLEKTEKKTSKIIINTHDNVIFKFDKTKSIIMMNPKYPRDYRVDNSKVPLKSCLKKV